MTRFAFLFAVWLGSASFASADEKLEAAKEARAVLSIKSLTLACEAYALNPANEKNAYPTILLELVKPPFGGAPYIQNGEKDLVDLWGAMYKYAVAKNEKGDLRPYVWVERQVEGKTRVIGTKPPEPKK